MCKMQYQNLVGQKFGRYKDITGCKFSKLSVLRKADKKARHIYWECQCDCGTVVVVAGVRLRNGTTKSCGCLSRPSLLGKRFGNLTVVGELPGRKHNNVIWSCKCDCGKMTDARTSSLIGNRKTSCGCNSFEFNDLKGKRFGKLTVIDKTPKRCNRYTIWLCKCDCGKLVEVQSGSLIAGNTGSCGCLMHRKGHENPCWCGVGEISGKMWSGLEKAALKRGLEFRITIEYIWELYQRQGGKCALSGIELSLNKADKTASLDRIDSSKGYLVGNVQWVHKSINIMKHDLDENYFISLCSAIHNHKTITTSTSPIVADV